MAGRLARFFFIDVDLKEGDQFLDDEYISSDEKVLIGDKVRDEWKCNRDQHLKR